MYEITKRDVDDIFGKTRFEIIPKYWNLADLFQVTKYMYSQNVSVTNSGQLAPVYTLDI